MCGNKTPGNLFAVGVMALVAVLSAVCIPRGINAALRRRPGESPKASVCERLSSRFPMKPRFVELNGGVARAVGRRCCNKRLRYRNGMIGHAYGVSGRCITNGCREVSVELSFASRLRERGVPFLFVLAPCKMSFDGGLMPCGWRCDNQNAESRAVARMLADSGVEVLDLVPRYASTTEDVGRHFFATDHHWNIRTALDATGAVCDRLGEILGRPELCGNPRLSISSWKGHVLKGDFVGSHGRRTGSLFSGTEDFEYFLPLFETEQESFVPGERKRRRGNFEAVEFDGKYLRPEQREWRWLAYGGPAHGLKVHRNLAPSANLRCMVVKDSFGRHPVAFLSTVFGEVVEVDPRLTEGDQTVEWAVDFYKPDVVVMIANPSSVLSQRWLKGMENGVKGKDVENALHVH